METEHPASAAIWQPQVAPANKDELYLFFKKLIFMITPNQSEILGIEFENYYRVLHKCKDSFLEGHSSAKQGTNYTPAPTACTQATPKYGASFFL